MYGWANKYKCKGENLIDPMTVLTVISESLNLVDRFTGLTKKFRGEKQKPHRVEADKKGDCLEIKRDGKVAERIHVSQLKMPLWDEKRYEALRKKVKVNWDIYNDIDVDLPAASVDEKARLKQRMESVRIDLCKDFREMMDIHENTLGVALGDHYSLYSVCGDLLK